MKSICLLSRREGLSRQEFHDYYEHNHAPLAVKFFPFRRYIRNHVVGAPDLGFDTISEFWADDTAALAAMMDGPVGERLREDEQRFMDRSKIAPASAGEQVLSPGELSTERYALLLNGAGDDTAIIDWARHLAAQTAGVSIDLVTSWQQPAFPARAVLWTPDISGVAELPTSLTAQTVRVRSCETPAQALTATINADSQH